MFVDEGGWYILVGVGCGVVFVMVVVVGEVWIGYCVYLLISVVVCG